jgi:uncharacterized repeat protein (TIGR02543 family)
VFDGWYKDAGLTAQWSFDVDTVNSDTTIYAKWVSEADANTEDFGGATPATIIVSTNPGESWTNALAAISTGGDNKNYVIIVDDDIDELAGLAFNAWNFGSVTGIKVSLRGPGSLRDCNLIILACYRLFGRIV